MAAGTAGASQPVMLGELDDGSVLLFVSSDGSGAQKMVRTRRVFATPQVVGEVRGVLSELTLQRIDCNARIQETVRMEWYGDTGATGEPLRALDVPASLRQQFVVGPQDRNIVAIVWTTACAPMLATRTPPRQPAAPATPASPLAAPAPASGEGRTRNDGWADDPGTRVAVPQARDRDRDRNPPAWPDPRGPGSGEAPPEQAREPGGPIAASRPFASSVFTLGTMGRLAEFIYFDENQDRFLNAVAAKVAAGRAQLPNGGGMLQALAQRANTRIDKKHRHYQEAMADKAAFLARESLVSVRLPAMAAPPISAFRAELYEHTPSGELILVFRGSQEPLDWVSNLWLGVDLLSLEAPHYLAARELTERLVRLGKKPIVVGHSLGGGMAQYVGQMYGLKVVAFNSSPLPARYIPAKATTVPQNIKLFSAVEFNHMAQQDKGRADPVSLRIPNFTEALAAQRGADADAGLAKAHQHLVAPVCVLSRPNPFRLEDEDAAAAEVVNGAFYPSAIGYMLTGKVAHAAAEVAIEQAIGQKTRSYLSAPVWQPDSNSAFDKRVSGYARKLVANAGIEEYLAARAIGKMGSVLYNAGFGSMWQAAKVTGTAVAATVGKLEFGLALMPHSMARFNRGMQAELGSDVFTAKAITAQCQTPAATYR